MTKGARNLMTALGLGAMGLTGRTSEAADRDTPTLVLRLTNHAGTQSDDLVLSQAEAERVFGAMGVRTVWSDTAAGSEDHGCAGVSFSVALLSPEMIQRRLSEGIGESVLGTAHRAARRAYIFSERISALGTRTRLDERVLLGRVIAHEVGHLLLRETGHSRTGIMVAGIGADPAKLRAQFTPEQARAIRALLESNAGNLEEGRSCGN